MNLPDKLNAQIFNAIARSINVIGRLLQMGVETEEFSPELNIKKYQNAFWGLLNGIISLYIFSGSPANSREKIYSTTNLALEIFIKGLKKA